MNSTGSLFAFDPVGFPMVWCDALAVYVHWHPVTKIQFEYFLCDAPDVHFDAAWYAHVLQLNPRVPPRKVSPGNYWRAFLTAVQPAEAQRFASWCGDGYRLPSELEWWTIYNSFRNRPPENLAANGVLANVEPRIRRLIERIDSSAAEARDRVGYGANLANQLLFRLGVMEWVRTGSPPSSWSTKGEPLPEFCGNLEVLDQPAPVLKLDPDGCRLPAAGFRLLFSPQSSHASPAETTPIEAS